MTRIGAAALTLVLASGVVFASDPDAAERQFRVARRLAAEGAPGAAAALRKVIELDPEGPHVAAALVEQAKLLGLAVWPEDTGTLSAATAASARGLLDRVVDGHPASSRALDARFYRGMLRLEPVAGHDRPGARLDLISVATATDGTAWGPQARYALAWIHEQDGHASRAFDGYQRILIDHPATAAAARARVGAGRILLRRGRFGLAARRLQQAIDAEVPALLRAVPLRENAVRRLLDRNESRPPLRVPVGMRSPCAMVPAGDGGALFGDCRQERVVEVDREGRLVGQWPVPDLSELAVDRRGRRYAATRDTLLRLEPDGRVTTLGGLGEYGSPSSIAADAAGGVWVLGRKGQRLARLEPGAATTVPVWENRDARLRAIVWDGARLLALDERGRNVIQIDALAGSRIVARLELTRPLGLAADPAGRLAVLDPREGLVRFLSAEGEPLGDRTLEASGVSKPLHVGLGIDGGLQLFDAAQGEWVKWP